MLRFFFANQFVVRSRLFFLFLITHEARLTVDMAERRSRKKKDDASSNSSSVLVKEKARTIPETSKRVRVRAKPKKKYCKRKETEEGGEEEEEEYKDFEWSWPGDEDECKVEPKREEPTQPRVGLQGMERRKRTLQSETAEQKARLRPRLTCEEKVASTDMPDIRLLK